MNESAVQEAGLPPLVEDWTPQLLTDIIGQVHPGAVVDSFEITDMVRVADGVSTSERASFNLRFKNGGPPLPERAVVKMSFDPSKQGSSPWYRQMHALFRNELNFYSCLAREVKVDVPLPLGSRIDPETNRYMLMLEDMRDRSAHFNSMMEDHSIETVQAILSGHARLHAQYWNSPRFKTDLSWLETHVEGDIETLMHSGFRHGLGLEMQRHRFKREIVERLETTEEELFSTMCALKRHQATLPQTLLHGDSHIGNTYTLPDGSAGFYDWQVFVRGFGMHDVSYLIVTALSIAQRRAHERDLIAYYREQLLANGVVDAPDLETLWLEYRRAMVWAVIIGWLGSTARSYGWELLVVALNRVATAYDDHGTRKLVANLP